MIVFDELVTFRECPNDISYTLFVSGCPRNCKDCFWKDIDKFEYELSVEDFENSILKQVNRCTVITFLGGEWYDNFTDYLDICKKLGFKTCLYTGEPSFDSFSIKYPYIVNRLDMIKVGEFNVELGTLDNKKTNQRFYNLCKGKIISEVKFYELY